MNNLDILISNLKEEILKEPLIKEYLRLKEIIKNNEEINKKILELQYLTKCNASEEEQKRYYEIKKELEENPLIHNYKIVEEEVKNYKEEIKNILDLL